MEKVNKWAASIINSVESIFYGKREVIEKFLVAILCRGHVLIEDVPGVGKTILARAIAKTLGGDYNQIQCTPDLLPSDVLGVSIYNQKTNKFEFRQGPVITNILLVDEINRATPRTQSALLEAMAEGQVSVEGRSIPLPTPFFLMATQSPTESEGTFPLPEVQKDRFFLSLRIGYPDKDSETKIMLDQRKEEKPLTTLETKSNMEEVEEMQKAILEVNMDEGIKDYIMKIIDETRTDNRLYMGVSPRGSLALYRGAQALAAIKGRDYVVPEDVKEMSYTILNKRLLIKSEFTSKGTTEYNIIGQLLDKIEVPGYKDAV